MDAPMTDQDWGSDMESPALGLHIKGRNLPSSLKLAMFRRMKKFFSQCVGGEKGDLRLEKNLVAVRGTIQGRQFTLDSFFEEVLQKRLQEEKEVRPAPERQFKLDAFFVELLQKRLQEED